MLLFFAVGPVINAAMNTVINLVINPGLSSNGTKKYSENIQYRQKPLIHKTKY